MRKARSSFLAVVAGIMVLALSAPASGEDLFTGTWTVALTPGESAVRDGAKAFEDAMVFEETQLLTENFAFYGFSPGTYTVPQDQPQRFSATLQSNTKGKLEWNGAIAEGRISGSLVWTKPDGIVWTFAFSGAKQAQ